MNWRAAIGVALVLGATVLAFGASLGNWGEEPPGEQSVSLREGSVAGPFFGSARHRTHFGGGLAGGK